MPSSDIRVELAGVVIQLVARGDGAQETLTGVQLEPFRCGRTADLELTIELDDRPPGADVGTRLLSEGGTSARTLTLENPYICGRFDEASGAGDFVGYRSPSAPETALRAIMSAKLPQLQGLAVHASSAIHSGLGYLFPGTSGAGKSTLVRTSGGDPVLSDEVSLIRQVDGRFRVFGSPFQGEFRTPTTAASAPLAAVAFPSREGPVGLRPISAAVALSRLLQCVVNYASHPSFDEAALDVAAKLVAEVPCFEITFRADEPVWPALVGALAV